MPSIPASALVSVLPGVIGVGGSNLDIVGLFLTQSAQIPVGSVISFASAADVAAYFGAVSTEATLATTYFAGYTGSLLKPAKLYFSRYTTAAVSGYLRGASVASLTLTQLQALSGVLTVTVGGTVKTSSTINLSSATSFSNAATIIQAAFTSPGFTVTYDTLSGGFLFTTTATGVSATMTYASGTLADGLNLAQADGAVLSQGSDAMVPGTAMAAIIAQTTDWVLFSTAWQPIDADNLAFAAWSHSTNNRFGYVGYTNSATAYSSPDTSSFAYAVRTAGYSGTVAIYDPNNAANIAAFVMGWAASLNFSQTNGRATAAYRRSGQIAAGVTNQTIATTLKNNGYNFVGSYSQNDVLFTLFQPGQISGDFLWLDSWVGQVKLNNDLQSAGLNLMISVGQIPYNADGYSLIETGLSAPIQSALNFGTIRAGIALSDTQKAEIMALVGEDVSDTVESQGWFLHVADPGATVRAARGSPTVILIYTDGESVQQLAINSIMVV